MEIYSRYKRPFFSGLKCPEHSLTEQVYKDQCDLNFLIRKYGLEDNPFALTMYLDPTSRQMQFVDTTTVPDLYQALKAQAQLRDIFNELSYEQQKRFDFSVDAFGDFCMSASEDEIKKLGLKNIVFAELPDPVAPFDPPQPVAEDQSSSEPASVEADK